MISAYIWNKIHHLISIACPHYLTQEEAQLMLTNPRVAFRGQSRSPNSSIPYVRCSFLLCNSNFVFQTHSFYDIRLQKMSWPWNWGQRSLEVIESGIIRKIVYGFLLVFFSDIVPKTHCFWDIRLQNFRDLENRVRGPPRSLEMSPCDRAHMTSYWRSIVTMALSHVVSEIFNVEKCRDIETGVRGYSRSLKEVPFYTPDMVSY